jgi:para-nitrobenzyl esterase
MNAYLHVWCVLIRRFMVALVLACVAVSGLAASAAAYTEVTVNTKKGPVTGIQTDTLRKFLGIPYAAPPVGNLRWKAPRPHASWKKTGPLDATDFGNHCPQPDSPFGTASEEEDCLYLNVFAPIPPTDTTVRYPVMVWIHGGSLYLGQSDDYDPTRLVEQGVVVVTFNYRLGRLGFLSHWALGKPHGNYGLLDQQFALKWVKKNIGRFGGKPKNVTIFGESAGALSVLSQLASPKAKGLFRKAIVESGAYSLTQQSLYDAELEGLTFAHKLKNSSDVPCDELGVAKKDTAACLRAASVGDVLTAQAQLLQQEGSFGFYPIVDGKVLKRSIGEALSSGRFNKVPVIQGSNHDEWRLFVELMKQEDLLPSDYQTAIAVTLKTTKAAQVAAEYPLTSYPSPSNMYALGALGTDAIFACNASTVAQSLSQYVKTFAYEFNDPNTPEIYLEPDPEFPLGAYHAGEIAYIFDFFRTQPEWVTLPLLNGGQQALSDTMIGYWTQFAKTGDPNPSPDAPTWPQYEATTYERASLVPVTPGVESESDFATDHHCAFWKEF